jgi:thiol-disulfide isomerase/thioredoxin
MGNNYLKKYVTILILLFISIAFLISCSSSDEKTSANNPQPAVGSQMPAGAGSKFMALDIDGNFHTLEHYKGKPLILNFWGTWCPPCRRELPDLKRIYAEYKPMGLEIIGLAVNDTPEKVRSFAEQAGLNWVMLIANRESAMSYRIGTGVPVTIFLDKDGNEVSRAIGARDYNFFKNEVEKII